MSGKSKGGNYEHVVIKILAKAFKPLGIHEDDVFRTKNSGATKAQPGDIQVSPALAKIFPVLVECKHYRTVKYKLGKKISGQPKSAPIFQWWKQVIREQKERKDKLGVLVFRQNNCPDLICLQISHYQTLCGHLPQWQQFTWSMFTLWEKQSLLVIPLEEFLNEFVKHTLSKGKKNANRN